MNKQSPQPIDGCGDCYVYSILSLYQTHVNTLFHFCADEKEASEAAIADAVSRQNPRS